MLQLFIRSTRAFPRDQHGVMGFLIQFPMKLQPSPKKKKRKRIIPKNDIIPKHKNLRTTGSNMGPCGFQHHRGPQKVKRLLSKYLYIVQVGGRSVQKAIEIRAGPCCRPRTADSKSTEMDLRLLPLSEKSHTDITIGPAIR